MSTFASVVFDPGAIAGWLAVGLILGWLSSKVMESATYGLAGDLLLGAIGACVGGFGLGLFVQGRPEFWTSMLVALVGAVVLIGGARALSAVRQG